MIRTTVEIYQLYYYKSCDTIKWQPELWNIGIGYCPMDLFYGYATKLPMYSNQQSMIKSNYPWLLNTSGRGRKIWISFWDSESEVKYIFAKTNKCSLVSVFAQKSSVIQLLPSPKLMFSTEIDLLSSLSEPQVLTDRPTDLPTDQPTDRLTDRQTNRQTGRKTDRKTNRPTKVSYISSIRTLKRSFNVG